MSIPVQCPNPACAKTHRVKNRWAGKRGTCPDCGSVIEVPGVPLAQSVASVPGPGATPDSYAEDIRPLSADITEEDSAPEEPGVVAAEEETLIADGAITEEPEPFLAEELPDADAATEAPTAPSGKRFSGLTAMLYLLGILGLGSVAAAPYLPMQAISGDSELYQKVASSSEKKEPPSFLLGVPAAAAAIMLVGLLASLAFRNFGLATLLTAYPSVFLAGVCLAFWGLLIRWLYAFDQKITAESPQRFGKFVEVTMGPGAWAAIGGSAAATAFLIIAILRTHRRLWAKTSFAVLAVVGLGLAGAFAFLVELK
jgi:hypothetical protein